MAEEETTAAEPRIVPSCASDATGRRGPVTDAPLPRFESVKAGEANFRRGPGRGFAIEWVLRLPRLPVCVISEHDIWRRVELPTGERGWLHAALLSRQRYAVFAEAPGSLRAAPDPAAETRAIAPPMRPLPLLGCDGDWCELTFDGAVYYAPRSALWGARPVDDAL